MKEIKRKIGGKLKKIRRKVEENQRENQKKR